MPSQQHNPECVGLLYLISVGKDPRQYAVCLGMLPMLMSYNMQSWTAINTSSGAFFLHLAHALMLSPAPLPQPLLIHCVHCLVAAAAKVADNKPQLASDKLRGAMNHLSLACLQHNFLVMQLQNSRYRLHKVLVCSHTISTL